MLPFVLFPSCETERHLASPAWHDGFQTSFASFAPKGRACTGWQCWLGLSKVRWQAVWQEQCCLYRMSRVVVQLERGWYDYVQGGGSYRKPLLEFSGNWSTCLHNFWYKLTKIVFCTSLHNLPSAYVIHQTNLCDVPSAETTIPAFVLYSRFTQITILPPSCRSHNSPSAQVIHWANLHDHPSFFFRKCKHVNFDNEKREKPPRPPPLEAHLFENQLIVKDTSKVLPQTTWFDSAGKCSWELICWPNT